MELIAAQITSMLNNLIDTDASFDPVGTFLAPFASINNQGRNTAMADVTRNTGSMATGLALGGWGDPHWLVNGCIAADANLKTFRPGLSDDPQVVVGWLLASAATAGNLLAFNLLPEPILLPTGVYSVSFVFRLTVDPNGRWDATVTING